MKQFKYSIICEDDAHRYFAQTFLAHHFTGRAEFVFDELFYKKFRCSNNAAVLKSYDIQIEKSSYLDPFNLDLVLVGVDFDNRNKIHFHKHLNNLYDKLNEKARRKAVIFFPVQAIEHWLIFLKRKAENPALTKTITGETENTKRKDAKEIIYGKKYSDRKALVTSLATEFDKEWLCTQSISFREFNNRIEQAINERA